MKKFSGGFKLFDKYPLFCLILVLILTIFFRYYLIITRFNFDHDSDLYSWIVKDIVINGHWRLIGQLTSTPGIFIGPFFYYLLIPFFWITNMDPIGVIGLVGIVGIAGVLSYYFIFKNLFNNLTGLTAAFMEAVMLWRVNHDRWVVPTIFMPLWEIWYFFVVMKLLIGDFRVLPILGFLIGLIWHINFSYAPILLVAPVAIFLSRKLPKLIDYGKMLIAFLIPSLPLFLFEFRHDFSQTKSFLISFTTDQLGGTGLPKFLHILDQISGNATAIFFTPYRFLPFPSRYFLLILLIILGYLVYKKIYTRNTVVVFLVWIISAIGYFTFSSKITSEYYFSSLETIFLSSTIVFIATLPLIPKLGKILYILVMGWFLVWNFYHLVFTENSYSHRGYIERKKVIQYIVADAKGKSFPCIGISYIAPPGSDLGFRYLFYLTGFPVNKPDRLYPIYTIVTPADLYTDEVTFKYGSYAIIPPGGHYDIKQLIVDCGNRNDNNTDSMFGYTQ